MLEMKFEDYLKVLEHRNGAIYRAGRRVIIVDAEWITGIQTEMEKIIGADGTYAVMRNAALDGGIYTAKALIAMFKDLSVEEHIKAFYRLAELTGYGIAKITEFSLEPFKMISTCENMYLSGIITGASEPKCHLFTTGAAFVEALLKEKGYDIEIDYEETMCVAKGDPHCEFKYWQKE